MKALIQDDKVIQISEEAFEVHPSLQWLDAPDGCETGWTLSDGQLVPPLPEPVEVTSERVRSNRNALLAESDWVVIYHTEKGTNIPLEWELYRQNLRDITAQEGFPYSITWPAKP